MAVCCPEPPHRGLRAAVTILDPARRLLGGAGTASIDAVVAAWHATADDLAGVRAILDRERCAPCTPSTAEAMAKAAAKEHALLAMMAGRVSAPGAAAARVGAEIEDRARATYRPEPVPVWLCGA